ncbi:MAG: carboxymuconolactone decarboxylase family protein [Flammeovirgaceae bacterium]
MTRLTALSPENATGKTKELFTAINGKLGMVPNMMRTMGNSSAVLEGYLNLSGALSHGTLGVKLGALIALTVAEANACDYCLSAHSFIGEKLANVDVTSLSLAREAKSNQPKIQAALTFALALVSKRGSVSDEDVKAVKDAGFSEGEVGEIVAHVALNIFTNYLNKTANTQIDFPVVRAFATTEA